MTYLNGIADEMLKREYERGRKDGYQECLDKYGWMLNGLLYDEDLPEEYRPEED